VAGSPGPVSGDRGVNEGMDCGTERVPEGGFVEKFLEDELMVALAEAGETIAEQILKHAKPPKGQGGLWSRSRQELAANVAACHKI